MKSKSTKLKMRKSVIIIIGAFVLISAGVYYVNTIMPINLLISGGPGGCRGPTCETFCQQNPQECQKWCEENPEICGRVMGGGFPSSGGFSGGIGPPNTVITFAKTVNFNADQFTEEDILKAKQLGANMITIWPGRMIGDDEFLLFLPERVSRSISFAHKNGLQVELRDSDVFPRAKNYEKYKASAILHVAEYAKFAEKYKVYRIVPFGEVDNDLFNHPDKITDFAQAILPEMRKHYSGQIGIGVTAPWRDSGFTFDGYDYLTFSAYPQTQIGMDKWLTPNPDANRQNIDEINLVAVTKWVREVADRSGVSTIHIGETGVQNIEEKDPIGDFQTVEVSKEKEAEFYDKMFSQLSDKVDGVSVFYNSKTRFMTINGDPAEEVVKDWYNRLGDT